MSHTEQPCLETAKKTTKIFLALNRVPASERGRYVLLSLTIIWALANWLVTNRTSAVLTTINAMGLLLMGALVGALLPIWKAHPHKQRQSEDAAWQVEQLRQVLKPFADAYNPAIHSTPDLALQAFRDENQVTRDLTLGDLRRAHEALEALNAGVRPTVAK